MPVMYIHPDTNTFCNYTEIVHNDKKLCYEVDELLHTEFFIHQLYCAILAFVI